MDKEEGKINSWKSYRESSNSTKIPYQIVNKSKSFALIILLWSRSPKISIVIFFISEKNILSVTISKYQ